MWRLFRFGVKGNTYSGNQVQFRIFGACATENDDLDDSDCFGTLEDKENYEASRYYNLKQGLASLATKVYSKNLSVSTKPIFEPNNIENIEKSLGNVQQQTDKNLKIVKHDNAAEKSSGESAKPLNLLKKRIPKFGVDNILSESTTEYIDKKKLQSRKTEYFDRDKLRSSTNEDLADDSKVEYDFTLPTEIYGKRLSYNLYGRKMLALCRERKLHDAIKVIEEEMPAQRVKPNEYCFHVLINACGKSGYTEKAFELFHKMKQIGLTPGKHAYTGLFNACANCPLEMKDFGLRNAVNLRKQIKDKEILLSPISYHAMIKAFGRLGEISTAFEIVDDMLIDRHRITTETMNFLLQACVSDKEAGFRHAIKVWRKLRMLNLCPSIHSYNLLLRCIKECSGGDSKLLYELLESVPSKRHQKKQLQAKQKISGEIQMILDGKVEPPPQENKKEIQHEEDGKYYQISVNNECVEVELKENMELEIFGNDDTHLAVEQKKTALPELLSKNFSRGQVIDLVSLDEAKDRLALLGGPVGILDSMKQDQVPPTAATFTFLLETLPSSLEVEEALLASMESCQVKPDIIFCNVLIKKRNMTSRHKDAKDVMDLMQQFRIDPDIVTFGCVAIGCRIRKEKQTLLADMKRMGIRPNLEIMSTFLVNSLTKKDYLYSLDLLKKLSSLNIDVDERIIKELEKGRKNIRETLREYEIDSTREKKPVTQQEKNRMDEMRVFLLDYNMWLTRSNVRLSDHPWAQYGYVKKPPVQSYVIAK